MAEKMNVLVVDDKKIIGDLFDFTLGYSGHHITVVDNANEAIEQVRSTQFDIAFLDIVMPDQDGVDTLKQIRQISPGLPIVMMSGFSVEDRRCKAKDLGAITCLKKPFEFDDVKRAIKEALGRDVE